MGINRSCQRPGFEQQADVSAWEAVTTRPSRPPAPITVLVLLLGLLFVACTPIRPVIKIGLLAPFEGLHRREGYTALTAMRQAIADFAPADIALMPLALDDTADAVGVNRAVRKMLQDEAVHAIIGPYSPLLAQHIQPTLAVTGLPWVMPLAIDPAQGFVTPDPTGEWAMPLLAAAAEAAQQQGMERLLLAGWTVGWPRISAEQASNAFRVPLLVSDQLSAIQPQDAILWIGAPETGATYFTALRTQFPNVPFFLGPQADSAIFSEHAQIIGPVYSLFWLDDDYEQWSTESATPSPLAYLTYRATQHAIAASLDQALPQLSWRLGIAPIINSGVPSRD